MQIRDNPGPKEVPLARRRGGAGLGGWIGGPASTAGHNGEAGPPQSRSESPPAGGAAGPGIGLGCHLGARPPPSGPFRGNGPGPGGVNRA
jgi:hypothetical protein